MKASLRVQDIFNGLECIGCSDTGGVISNLVGLVCLQDFDGVTVSNINGGFGYVFSIFKA